MNSEQILAHDEDLDQEGQLQVSAFAQILPWSTPLAPQTNGTIQVFVSLTSLT